MGRLELAAGMSDSGTILSSVGARVGRRLHDASGRQSHSNAHRLNRFAG